MLFSRSSCVDWRGCIACDDAVYIDHDDELNQLFDETKVRASVSSSSLPSSSSATLLRSNLGNRRRSRRNQPTKSNFTVNDDPNAPASVTAKGLTKLFFEPLAVLESIFGTKTGAGAEGDDLPPSQITLSQEESNVGSMSFEERANLLQSKQRELVATKREMVQLERDTASYTATLDERAIELETWRSRTDRQLTRVKKYKSAHSSVVQELYRIDKRYGELREEVRRTIRAIVHLDSQDRKMREADENETNGKSSISNPSSESHSDSFHPFHPPTTLSSSHHYLQLPHNDFWQDLLVLDPNLVGGVHHALTGQEVLPIASHLDLIELGLGEMPSLRTKEALNELTRVARSHPYLQLLGQDGLDPTNIPNPPDLPPEPSDQLLAQLRRSTQGLQEARIDLLKNLADDPTDHIRQVEELRTRLERLNSTVRANGDRAILQERKLRDLQLEYEAMRVRLDISIDATTKAVTTDSASMDNYSVQPTKKQKVNSLTVNMTTSTEFDSMMQPSLASTSQSLISSSTPPTDLGAEHEEEYRMRMAEAQDEDDDCNVEMVTKACHEGQSKQSHPNSLALSSSLLASSPSVSAPTSSLNSLTTSTLSSSSSFGHSRHAFLLQPPVSTSRMRLAAALEAVDRIDPTVVARGQLNIANIVELASKSSSSANGSNSSSAAPQRANPFGIRPNTASSDKLTSYRSIGGDLIVHGHDGRGGKVTLLRSNEQVAAAKQKQQIRPKSTPKSTIASSPQTAVPSASPKSSSLFSLDQLAYRPRSVSSRNTKSLERSLSATATSSITSHSSPTLKRSPSTASNQSDEKNTSLSAMVSTKGQTQPLTNEPILNSTTFLNSSSRPIRRQPSIITTAEGREIVDLIDDDDDDDDDSDVNMAQSSSVRTHPFFKSNLAPTSKPSSTLRPPLQPVHNNATR